MVMQRTLAVLAQASGGHLVGDDREFHKVISDSRQMEADALFVCLSGPRFDGHDFVDAAASAGAAGVLVSRSVTAPVARVEVEDTLVGLGRFAHAWRNAHTARVAAVTGSNGKTTTKNLLAAVFVQMAPTLATTGNYNNQIGVPLTLARLERGHGFAVIELGTNAPGEIAALAAMTRPEAAVITSVAAAHLEKFGDIAGVAQEKGSLLAALPPEGLAVAPADCEWLEGWRRASRVRRWVTYGLDERADVYAKHVEFGPEGTRFRLVTPESSAACELQLLGRHNVANALAAAALAWGLQVPVEVIARGLAVVRPAPGRLALHRLASGAVLIDDTYNANPASVSAAAEAARITGREVWLVLGELGELGPEAAEWHRRVGRDLQALGVSRLYTLGPLAAEAGRGFGSGASAMSSVEDLVAEVRGALPPHATLVVKGSRSARMERVVAALLDQEGGH